LDEIETDEALLSSMLTSLSTSTSPLMGKIYLATSAWWSGQAMAVKRRGLTGPALVTPQTANYLSAALIIGNLIEHRPLLTNGCQIRVIPSWHAGSLCSPCWRMPPVSPSPAG
jgi:hypothetical protein